MNINTKTFKVMKLRNLAISALAATFAVVSCNKQDTAPMADSGLMAVEISLENLNFTKAPTDAFLTSGDAAQLNNFKVFLTDGTNLLEAKSLDGQAPKYFYSAEDGDNLADKVTIDLVPAAVNKVVIVGNVDNASWGDDAADLAALRALTVEIEDEQIHSDLTLFGEAGLVATGRTHDHEVANTTYGVYSADVQLAPLVARFELDGFAFTFSGTNPKFDKVEVKQIALNNYYGTAAVSPVTPSDLVNNIQTVTDQSAMDYFAANLQQTDSKLKWYYDVVSGISFERANADADGMVKANMDQKLSYHFFPAETDPQLFIELSVTPTGDSVSLPSYVYSKSFKKSNGEPVTFEPGYVYRMNFAGSADNGDGDIPFDEDDINQIEKCLEITVEVLPWQIVSIYPEF